MPTDYLTPILARKRLEIARRLRHRPPAAPPDAGGERATACQAVLRRPPGQPPRIIAEIKRRSPSAGEIRPWRRGDVVDIARQYVRGGASAVSVLCDRPGFGGSALDLRRAARAVSVPLLFKEFVLDACQIELARAAGAHMVLLVARALDSAALSSLVRACIDAGLAPVVEAASDEEVERALQTPALLIGVNARDLGSFRVDPARAHAALAAIPSERVAIHMSGVHTRDDFRAIAAGRADAVLIGESLMRAASPEALLKEFLRP